MRSFDQLVERMSVIKPDNATNYGAGRERKTDFL
jgi:hypothetical protein